MLRREHQGTHWELAPEFEPLLATVLADAGETVKQTSITQVTRHRVAGRVFYVKRYQNSGHVWLPAKFYFRAPKSRREWNWAAQMKQRGVAVVPHLAHGERWSWRGLLDSTLITEGLPGYADLKGVPDLKASDLQFALGRFLRQVHDAGVLYLDIAPQNVLYSAADHAFRFIDVDKVACRRQITRQQRLDNIILLAVRLPLIPQFYDGYGKDFAWDARQIAQQARAERQSVMTRLSRRWQSHVHQITTERVGELRWLIRKEFDNADLRRVMEHPAESSVAGLVVRRFGGAGARRAYRKAYRRELLGQAGIRPTAVGEKRCLGICVRSYFVGKE